MKRCHKHVVCEQGFVQGPEDVDTIIACMVASGDLVRTISGKLVTPRRARRGKLALVQR